MLRGLGAFTAGTVFGAGLLVSGMTQPERVLGFLNVFGAWDPSLVLVMVGAIAVHFLAYRVIGERQTSLAGEPLTVPRGRALDRRLFFGAALFGVGWGLGGYCPGPSVVSLATGAPNVVVFVAASIVGTLVARALEARSRERERPLDGEPSQLSL